MVDFDYGSVNSWKKVFCTVCNDSGFELVKADASSLYGTGFPPVEIAVRCRACNGGQQERIEFIKQYSNLPPCFQAKRYHDFDWSLYNCNTSRQETFVESMIDDFNSWEQRGLGLYIFSKTRGSGKSYLSSIIANEIIEKNIAPVYFVSFADLIEISTGKSTVSIDALCEVRLLVVDDLGSKKNGNDWLGDILFKIFDFRLVNGLCTIVTSNVALANLQFDDRVCDRLNRMCQQLPLPEVCVRAMLTQDIKKNLYQQLNLEA